MTQRSEDSSNGTMLDRIDRHILEVLQREGRIHNQVLADTVGLSPSACHRRVRRLEQDGVIIGYGARIDPHHLGYGNKVFIGVTLERQCQTYYAAFETAVDRCPEVMACHLLSGNEDYLLEVAVGGMDHYERFHRETLSQLPGVVRLRSEFSIRTVADRTAYTVLG